MSKKSKIPNPKVPRSLEEITRAVSELFQKAGNYQYTISAYTSALADVNSQLKELDKEVDARKQLDAANAKQAAETAEQNKSGAV